MNKRRRYMAKRRRSQDRFFRERLRLGVGVCHPPNLAWQLNRDYGYQWASAEQAAMALNPSLIGVAPSWAIEDGRLLRLNPLKGHSQCDDRA